MSEKKGASIDCTAAVGLASGAGIVEAQAVMADVVPPVRPDGAVGILRCASCVTKFCVTGDGQQPDLRLESESLLACIDSKVTSNPMRAELGRGEKVTSIDLGAHPRKEFVSEPLFASGWD